MTSLCKKHIIQKIAILLCSLIFSGCQWVSGIIPSVIANKNPSNQNSQNNPMDVFKANLITSQQNRLNSFKDATRYEIQIKIEDDLTSIAGHQDVFYTNQETTPLDRIYFELLPNTGGKYLTVENIKIDGLPVTGNLVFKGSVMRIDLTNPLQPGKSLAISMDFLETVPDQMGGNYGLYIFQDNILALDSFFPIIPVYDEAGWHVQDLPPNADLIFTDPSFFTVQVDAPDTLVLAASGVEISGNKQKGRQIVSFVGGPQRDFYLAASSRFQSESSSIGEVKVTSFFPDEFKGSGELVLKTAEKALQVFSNRYGPYPYTELDLASTPMRAGGMEYSGAAAMSLALYGTRNTAGGTSNNNFLEYATAHEVAHQWFFDQVMNDQLKEPWLDEAFAQYLTYIYYLDTYGSSAAEQITSSWKRYWSSVNNEPIPIGKPAGEYDQKQYSAIIYGRAPFFILELEKKMGSEVFSQFLADYVKTYQWKTTDSRKFKSLAETDCSCNLTVLFDAWGVHY
jgi:hypothetical protein